MIAGGASLAPRRWSLDAEATEARSRPPYRWTARITAAQNTRNWALSCGVSPGHQQAAQLGVAEREVDVLARAVDAGEGLLVEEALHAVLLGDRLEGRHQQLLVVGGDVGALEHRRDLELAGRDLVVAGLGGDAELEELALGVHHEAEHPLGDGAEVVVVELLALGRLGAEEGAAGVEQVGAGEEEVAVDQEVLLLGAAVATRRARGRRGRRASGRARRASAIACCERSSGVLWSRASPVIETKTVGMQSVLPLGFSRTYAGLMTSQPV